MARRTTATVGGILGVLLILDGGCIAFNQECQAPADLVDPDATVGWLAEPIPVTENDVRTKEMAIGNLIADAFADAYNDIGNPNYRTGVTEVRGAIENAGGIRNEGFCTEVDALPGDPEDPPPLTRADLREVMPFTNRVVVVELTAPELVEVFEHSVSALGDAEDPDKGFFLQVSGDLKIVVDCTGTPQEVVEGAITVPGTRVKAIHLGTEVIETCEADGDCSAGTCQLPEGICTPTDLAQTYRIATNDFLIRADGNDGFVTLAGRPGFNSLGRLDVEVVEDYLGMTSSPVAPYQPKIEGRLDLTGCD